MSKIHLSIIIPALKEEGIIGDTLIKLDEFLRAHPELGTTEVVVVAADAGDHTAAAAYAQAKRFEHFQVVEPGSRLGKGRDVRAGMLAAKGELRLFTDADLATPLKHIPDMVTALQEHDVVIGVRRLANIHKGIRAFVSQAGNMLIQKLLLPGINDSQCGFKGFRAAAAKKLFSNLQTMRWGFDMEILARAKQAKLSIGQLPIPDWREVRAEHGLRQESKIGVAIESLVELLRIRLLLWQAAMPWLTRLWWVLPLGAFGLAGVFYFNKIGEWSIWFDEAFSAAIITFDPWSLIAHTAADVHPPLYYLVLQGWASIFGHGEVGLRSLSAVCLIAAMAVGFILVRRCFGKRASYIVLPFLVLAPFLLRYGQEARMYGMAALICISATYVLVRATEAKGKRGRGWWIFYTLLVIAGLYTHYYTALIWIAHWLWRWYSLRQAGHTGRGLIRLFFSRTWISVHIAIGLAFLPWLPILIKQFVGVQAGFWIGPVSQERLLNIASNALAYHQIWQLESWLSLGFIIICAGLALLFYRTYHALVGKQRLYFALLLLYCFVPIVMLFMLSLPPLRPIMVDRYFVQSLVAFYLLIGVALSIGPPVRRWFGSNFVLGVGIMAYLILGISTVYAVGNYNFNEERQPQAKPLMAGLEPRLTANSALIANSPYLYYELIYYSTKNQTYFYDPDHALGRIGSTSMLVGSPHLVNNLQDFGDTKQSMWLIGIGEVNQQIPASWRYLETYTIGRYNAIHYQTNSLIK